eukprot:CAMPEP_0198263850 /NCGR_PEP_ID=MMETSP1447-20131203/13836_1 /TAXON_ID=420782 /ORGANISM="Chaetoceros dichaeta, Strain CCMP1751" /LENGTH=196 /DNA_ID=CAMNT_0043952597 /DNA_START=23 /DNA_END=613 /DNA_ORIENTATION=-
MKTSSALIVAACVASSSAFAPDSSNQCARHGTELFAAKKKFVPSKKAASAKGAKKSVTLSQRIFDMDLFSPVKEQNDFGARNTMKKDFKTGTLSKNSYVPQGLTKAQYEKVRSADSTAKKNNYNKFFSKVGTTLGFYEFYKGRGTDTSQGWKDKVTAGHVFAKTKYDWQGDDDLSGSNTPKSEQVKTMKKKKAGKK